MKIKLKSRKAKKIKSWNKIFNKIKFKKVLINKMKIVMNHKKIHNIKLKK
jgi:hypothetical protein